MGHHQAVRGVRPTGNPIVKNPIPQPRPVLHVPPLAASIAWWLLGGALFVVLCVLSAAMA